MEREKLFYTIGETAGILGENVSLVRFWSESFPKFVRPRRNAKGNRLYTKEDVEMLKRIHFLVKDCGMTLEGAAKRLRDETAKIDKSIKVIESLKNIRSQLIDIKEGL